MTVESFPKWGYPWFLGEASWSDNWFVIYAQPMNSYLYEGSHSIKIVGSKFVPDFVAKVISDTCCLWKAFRSASTHQPELDDIH